MTTELSKISARILLLPVLMIAMGLMVKGYADTGDGFSAGVIASLGIGMQLIIFGHGEMERLPLIRFAPYGVFAGLFIALLTAFVPSMRGENLFTHWPPAGEAAPHFGMLELITAVVFDIGVFLVVFGFGVGVLGAIARGESRMMQAEEREARGSRVRTGNDEAGTPT